MNASFSTLLVIQSVLDVGANLLNLESTRITSLMVSRLILNLRGASKEGGVTVATQPSQSYYRPRPTATPQWSVVDIHRMCPNLYPSPWNCSIYLVLTGDYDYDGDVENAGYTAVPDGMVAGSLKKLGEQASPGINRNL